jgi:hypothetical protein
MNEMATKMPLWRNSREITVLQHFAAPAAGGHQSAYLLRGRCARQSEFPLPDPECGPARQLARGKFATRQANS